METKHTKGEWEVLKSHSILNPILISSDYGNICTTISGDEEDEANAKLIAAAPELLEALIRLKEMAWSDGVDSLEVYEICKSAINKATK